MNDISSTPPPSAVEQLGVCERELRSANELLDRAFASVNVMLAYMDSEFNFVKVNEAYAAADNRTPAFFVGKNHFALYPNPENEVIFRHAVRTGERYVAIEKPFVYAAHPERGISYWDWNLQPVKNDHGGVEGVMLTLLDVTEKVLAKQRAEKTATYARSLIEASLDPLVTIGADGTITDVNAATEQATGVARDELIGTDFSSYFVHPERARAGYQEVFRIGFVRDYPLEIRHRDGHITPVLYNASIYRDESGAIAGVFAAARDITERRRAEEALHQLNRELDLRVRERTAALEESNRELESFSYSISHDLRTPLRAIDGFSKILLADYDTKLDEEGKRLLHVVRENTEKMGLLIGEILNLSRTGRVEMVRVPVDMAALVHEVWAEVMQIEPGRHIELRVGDLPRASGDRNLLRQLWLNLLGNAAKFTRGRDVALIEVAAQARDGEAIYQVKDNGVGFDMRYVDRLFGVFARLHSAEEFEGTGVGLAIVKRIAVRHGGRVWAEGKPGEGATFYVALPKADGT